MTLETLGAIGILGLAVWAIGVGLGRLVSLLRVEHVRRTASGQRHTWRDTLAILGFVAVFFAVAATGISDKGMIRLLLVAIAVYYVGRQWKERRQGDAL
jgi:hypothetical protein